MTACTIAAGVEGPGCEDIFSTPGVDKNGIYLFNHSEVASLTAGAVDGEISAIVLEATKVAYKMAIHKDTGMYEENLVTGEGHAPYYTQKFSVKIVANDTATVQAIEKLVGVDLLAVCHLRNGNYRIVGEFEGVKVKTNDYSSGKTAGDEVGEDVTFEGVKGGKASFFLDTDEATSKATLEGYLTA